MDIRAFIIRNFALSHKTKLFGRLITTPRAAAWIVESICWIWISTLFSFTSLSVFSYIALIFGVCMSFIYLRLKPIDRVEDENRLDSGQLYEYYSLLSKRPLLHENRRSAAEYEQTLREKRFHKAYELVFPIFQILTCIILTLLCQ